MNNHSPVPVGVLGASGYVGQELLRLLAGHPGASVVFATAHAAAGEVLEGHRLLHVDDAPLGRVEVVLSALPHGVSARYVHEARAAGKRAVDLSADFRLSPEAVYGLTEVTRPRVAAAELVANPGCYPTAALLALLPLAQRGLIDASREVMIDAASGVTGAGRTPARELLFGEVAEDFRAYAAGNTHRHLPELKATLARESGFTGDLVFTPHLLPVKRGILETIHVPLTRVLDQATAEGLYDAVYADEPCVVVMHGTLPALKDVVYRNRVAIGVVPVANVCRPRLTVIAAIDNLVKGAAGQAIQNMNVMLGLPETAGLTC
ncbi:MAG: N-acetyl-gamma-glutamyl-phosphate reductase [bacterium]